MTNDQAKSTVLELIGGEAMTATQQQIASWLRLFVAPDQVTELRCLPRDPNPDRLKVAGGYFDGAHLPDMAREAWHYSRTGQYAVYFTPNPLRPDLLQRRPNRAMVGKPDRGFAHDADVVGRRWFFVDVDPVRPDANKDDSASEIEKAAAWEVAQRMRDELRSTCGWDEPSVVVDSGNGWHLYWPVHEFDAANPQSDAAHRLLQALAHLCDTDAAKIDVRVGNPARIMKVPGTMSNKGVSTSERPHRVCKVLS